MSTFDKHPSTIVHGEDPFNAEPELGRLGRSFLTPGDLFYARNHAPVPEVDPERYRLVVSGLVGEPLELSLDEVRGFAKSEVTAVLQCAGNRRNELIEVAPMPGETPWRSGAIGNARWGGAPLREVLLAAGIEDEARHAAFVGLDEVEGEDGDFNYGGSIPIEKALSPEVLLAYEMNGEPLAPGHGSPLRLVVPGYIGARSVKWLSRVDLQRTPSDNHYQANEYRLLPPGAETDDVSGGFTLGETPVNAVICAPEDGGSLPAGPVTVRGYAVAGGGRSVEWVDVSVNGGKSWVRADLVEGGGEPWAWSLWEANLNLAQGKHDIVVRAFDSSAGTQPATAAELWNPGGYANNSWHRVEVNVG